MKTCESRSQSICRIPLVGLEASIIADEFPSINTITFYRGLPPLDYLQDRVSKIVNNNPWLEGKIVKSTEGKFLEYDDKPINDSFVVIKDFYINLPDTYENGFFINDKRINNLRVKTGSKCVNKEDEKLFKVIVITSDPNINQEPFYAVIFTMNHVIADGYTFYKIQHMLSTDREVQPMIVERVKNFTEKCSEQPYTVKLWMISTWIALRIILTVFYNLFFQGNCSLQSHAVCDKYLEQIKYQYKDYDVPQSVSSSSSSSSSSSMNNNTTAQSTYSSSTQSYASSSFSTASSAYNPLLLKTFSFSSSSTAASCKTSQTTEETVTDDDTSSCRSMYTPTTTIDFVSTNDILTSMFFKSLNVDIGFMCINFRNRFPEVTDMHAGNYETLLTHHKVDFDNPAMIRRSLLALTDTTLEPTTEYVKGIQTWRGLFYRFGFLTNWSTFYHDVLLPNSSQLLHMPLFQKGDLNGALNGANGVIFKTNKNTVTMWTHMDEKIAFECSQVDYDATAVSLLSRPTAIDSQLNELCPLQQ